MRDEDIDFSDLPEIPPEKFAHALVRKGLKPIARKSQITLRIDADVLEWFRAKGTGYQSQMNAVLKAYKEAHQSQARIPAARPHRKSSPVRHDDPEIKGLRARTAEGTLRKKRG